MFSTSAIISINMNDAERFKIMENIEYTSIQPISIVAF